MRLLIPVLLASTISLFAQEPVQLQTLFRTGISSDRAGLAGIAIADFDGIAGREIISCSGGSPFALSRAGDTYVDIWYGPQIDCVSLAVAEFSPTDLRIVAAGNTTTGYPYYDSVSGGTIYVFSSDSLQAVEQFVLPGDAGVRGVRVGEVDGDGELEIVAINDTSTFVFDATTFELEWQADDRGGPRLELADIDGDGVLEVITGGAPAHFLSPKLKKTLWSYLGGFGRSMAVGDGDGDGDDEVGFIDGYYPSFFDPGTQEILWTGTDAADAVGFADVDGDGIDEMLIGPNQWGSVLVVESSTGVTISTIPSPEHGTSTIIGGDLDDDGIPEVVWGAGLSSSGADAFFVGDWQSQTLEWEGVDLDPPLSAALGDLEGDGKKELVVASRSTGSGYDGGILIIRDGTTFEYERVAMDHYHSLDISQMRIGQLDDDMPQNEILLGGNDWSDGTLVSLDGLTTLSEWTSKAFDHDITAMTLANLDEDAREEVILSSADRRIYILNGAGSVIQWLGPILPEAVRKIVSHDLGNDGITDLIVTTPSGIYTFETSGPSQTTLVPVSEATAAIVADGGTESSLLVIEDKSDYWTSASAISRFSMSGDVILQCAMELSLKDLSAVRTVDGNRVVAVGARGGFAVFPEVITSCDQIILLPQFSNDYRGVEAIDLEGDGIDELLLSAGSSIEIVRLVTGDPVAGDANGDGALNVADVFYLINHLFAGGPPPAAGADANGDGALNVADIFYLINHLFAGGPPPVSG